MHVSLGSPLGRAPAVAGERVVVATICPLRRLRRHLSQRERLFANSIITQIGRENKFSAEIYVSRTVEDACPYNFGLSKHPYENLPKRGVFQFRA